MTQTPNPNSRRRRLTADELIAIMVAMAGIGSIFWWSISHRQPQAINVETSRNPTAENSEIVQILPLTDSATTTKTKKRTATAASAPVSQAAGVVAGAAAVSGTAGETIGAEAPKVVDSASPVPSSSTLAFTDVPNQYWDKDSIAVLKARGILDDFGTGQFEPNLPVTRGEYAKMLDRAFDRPVSQQVLDFKDIPADYPRKEAVDKSVKMGFMSGYSKTKFSPNEQIPRYQLQISLAKGLGLKIPDNVEAILTKYADAKAMPQYAREKMAAAIASDFIIKDGQTNQLQPLKSSTRGEAVALIYQSLVKDGKIPAGK